MTDFSSYFMNRMSDGQMHFFKFRNPHRNNEELWMYLEDGYCRFSYDLPKTSYKDGSPAIDWGKGYVANLEWNSLPWGFRLSSATHGTEYYPISGPNKKPYNWANKDPVGKYNNYYGYGGSVTSTRFHVRNDGTVCDESNNPLCLVRTNYGTWAGFGNSEIPVLIEVMANIDSNSVRGDERVKRDVPNQPSNPSVQSQLTANETMMLQSLVSNFYGTLQGTDMNRDGMIDKNEFIQVLVRANTPYQQAVDTTNKIFQILDKDGNGLLTWNDIQLYNQNPNSQQPQVQPQQPIYPQQQPYGGGSNVPVNELQIYMNLNYIGYPIYKRGTMEEYYCQVNGAFKQINWLRDNVGGGQWVKVGW